MNEIVAAVFSNISYALADNVNGVVTKKNQALQVAYWASVAGVLLFLLPAIIFFSGDFQRVTVGNLTVMLLINILVNIGYLSFLTGMSKGSITLTGVIGGSFPACTTLAAFILFHEHITSHQLGFILLIFLGIILSSLSGSVRAVFKEIKTSGAVFALGAFFFWGLYFALVRIPIQQVGWFLPQYTSSFVGIIIYYLIARITKNTKTTSRPSLPLMIMLLSFLQMIGSIFFNYAISKGQTAIVAPIAGSSPAIFVAVAYFLFKEKLNKKQWIGIIAAVVGIVGLSLVSTTTG